MQEATARQLKEEARQKAEVELSILWELGTLGLTRLNDSQTTEAVGV